MKTTTMLAALTTAALLPALLPQEACAADAAALAANGIPVDPSRSVSGHFDAGGTQAWRVYLRAGRYYAVWGSNNAVQDVAVQAAGGRTLVRFEMDAGGNEPSGASFRAPYTGLYSVVVAQPASCWGHAPCVGPGGQGSGDYSLSAGKDCPGDISTACSIAVGATLDNLQMRFLTDDDWFRTTFQAGGVYKVALADPDRLGFDARVAIRDARGATVAQATWDGEAAPVLAYRAARGGTYYVEVFAGSDEPLARYSLTLSR